MKFYRIEVYGYYLIDNSTYLNTICKSALKINFKQALDTYLNIKNNYDNFDYVKNNYNESLSQYSVSVSLTAYTSKTPGSDKLIIDDDSTDIDSLFESDELSRKNIISTKNNKEG